MINWYSRFMILHLLRNVFDFGSCQLWIGSISLENWKHIFQLNNNVREQCLEEVLIPIETKSLSSRTSLMTSSGSRMAPPAVFRISCTTSSRLGTKEGGFSFRYRRRASSPNHRIVFSPMDCYCMLAYHPFFYPTVLTVQLAGINQPHNTIKTKFRTTKFLDHR